MIRVLLHLKEYTDGPQRIFSKIILPAIKKVDFIIPFPVMYWFELQDITFFVKLLKDPSDNFDIHDYGSFVSSSARYASSNKRKLNYCCLTTSNHFYFNWIVRLWNALPPIEISTSLSISKTSFTFYLWNDFFEIF